MRILERGDIRRMKNDPPPWLRHAEWRVDAVQGGSVQLSAVDDPTDTIVMSATWVWLWTEGAT